MVLFVQPARTTDMIVHKLKIKKCRRGMIFHLFYTVDVSSKLVQVDLDGTYFEQASNISMISTWSGSAFLAERKNHLKAFTCSTFCRKQSILIQCIF